jgi:hypothetical protein
MIALPYTVSLYFGRQFAVAVALMLAALTALVALFDFLELLRESAAMPATGFGVILEMEVLRIPWMLMQILPFAVLLGGIFSFWRLTRSSELVVARAAGISAWQFLAVPVLLATCLGLFGTGAISPVSALMFSRAETLYNAYLTVGGGPLSLNGGDLWVRQADRGLVPDGIAVLHAGDVRLAGQVLRADEVSVLRLSSETARDAGRRRLGFARGFDSAGRCRTHLAGADVVPDRSDRAPGAGKFRLAGCAVVLVAAGVHQIAETLRLLADPARAGVPGAAGAAVAVRDDGAGGGRVFHAPVAARRGDADAGGRGCLRLRAVHGLGGFGPVRHLRRGAGGAGGLGAGGGGHAIGACVVAASGRWLKR